jgi:hypothetical protein
MQRWLLLFVFSLTACTSAATHKPQSGRADYPDQGAAPELTGEIWLNTTSPLSIADLKGKVVLLDMWTFG